MLYHSSSDQFHPHLAPASVNPPLVNGEGGEEECADVEIDKAQAQDGKVAKVPVDKMSYIFYHSCRIIV